MTRITLSSMSSFHWVLLDDAGNELRSTESFTSKEGAESWMGAEWAALLEEGAESVALTQDDARLYVMGLREA